VRSQSRRQFVQGSLTLGCLGLLAGCGLVSPPWRQTLKVARIGHLANSTEAGQTVGWLDAFREGLRRAGYVEGQSIEYEYRWADNRLERLPELAADLVRRNVDILVTYGTPGVTAARQATSTIPIVMAFAGDPIGTGFVETLARPGGNVTGLTTLAPELAPKRLQLLKESSPGISRIGVLHNPDDPGRVLALRETVSSARMLGLADQALELRDGDGMAATLTRAIADGVDALVVLQGGAVNNASSSVVGVVAQHRLPAMYDGGEYVNVGGLMYYGPSFVDLYRRAAGYVDRILKGANPADLPIERPSRFDFLVNLKTAQALGLTIPPSVLQQATEVIQ